VQAPTPYDEEIRAGRSFDQGGYRGVVCDLHLGMPLRNHVEVDGLPSECDEGSKGAIEAARETRGHLARALGFVRSIDSNDDAAREAPTVRHGPRQKHRTWCPVQHFAADSAEDDL
jgi:hypothetical protein